MGTVRIRGSLVRLCLAGILACFCPLAMAAPMQKMILFLQEPIHGDSLFVRGLTSGDLTASHAAPAAELAPEKTMDARNPYRVVWNRSGNSLPQIVVFLPLDAGAARLDAYDLYGKRIASLFAGPLRAGRNALPRGEEWGQIDDFHGICYFELEIDGRVMRKEIFAKVQ